MYRGQSGQWSWLFHRVTGLAVLIFLLIHIVDITLVGFGPNVYNDALKVFSTAPFRIFTLALIAALLYHSFNGIRIILVDFWPQGYKYQRAMFYIVMVATVLCAIGSAVFILAPIFGACPQSGYCSAGNF
jgi:succinate dehydrogenase / fumarate reductase, cytochrome b subunit